MDDIQLVASVAAGDLLAFRDSQFPLSFVNANPAIFLSSDWVHPAQLRVFLASRDVSTSTCQSTISVKLEPSQASVSIRPQEPRVKTEDSEIIEILSSDDEMEVEASLQPSGTSSDPPDPSDSLDHNDSDDEPGDLASVALSTTFWGDMNIISRTFDGPATINRQGKVKRVK
ncbi:hypothetical protein B0H14DRAFT_3488986 [Mycena olivaceomarginata]|nr:hypothetical protein B0H14DRAFT_3488986 [Mycena olivaceomarginata]